MADSLFPVFDVPTTVPDSSATAAAPVYNPAPLYDYEAGDIARNGAGQSLWGSAYDAWVFWCIKTVSTERYARMAYSDNAGIEADAAFKQPTRAARESAFERTITEALMADPMNRTQSVQNFTFDWSGADALHISCQVTGRDGNSATISTTLVR
jgi:hypothetical protein